MSENLPFGVTFGDADHIHLDDYRRATMPFPWNKLREKRWLFAGILHPQVIAGMAVVRVDTLVNAFAYVYYRPEQLLFEHTLFGLPPQLRFDADPINGTASFFTANGFITLGPLSVTGRRPVSMSILSPGKSIQVEAALGWFGKEESALNLLAPMPKNRFAFTRKAAGFPVTGFVRCPGRRIELNDGHAFGIFDWTLGYHRRDTFWNWAAGAGRDSDGRAVGFNMSAGVYLGSSTENAVWIDGQPTHLGEARFEYNPQRPLDPWKVRTADGCVDLVFTPENRRQQNLNLGLIASRFVQPFGAFSGTIRASGGVARIDGVPGVVEQHQAKW